MIDVLRHARAQLTAAQSRCQRPSVDAQFRTSDAFAKLRVAEQTGKHYAVALAAVASAMVELAESER